MELIRHFNDKRYVHGELRASFIQMDWMFQAFMFIENLYR